VTWSTLGMAIVPAVVSGVSGHLPEILGGSSGSLEAANPPGTASSLSHPGTSEGEPDSCSQPARLRLSDRGENVGLGPMARQAPGPAIRPRSAVGGMG